MSQVGNRNGKGGPEELNEETEQAYAGPRRLRGTPYIPPKKDIGGNPSALEAATYDLVEAEDLDLINHNSIFTAAKAYKSFGWKLVKVDPRGGCRDITGPDIPVDHWEDNPGGGLGVKTGFASGIVGLGFIDSRHQLFIEQKYGQLAGPCIVGEGIVYCFRAPKEDFPNKTIIDGVEYIGRDRFTPAPPTLVEGKMLQWKVNDDFPSGLPEIPLWLKEILTGKKLPVAVPQPTQSSQKKGGRSETAGHHDAALRYAERGWLVFPLNRGQKTPTNKNGHKDATRDRGTIAKWWERWRSANIGVQTGANSGIVVLDVDVKNGVPGLESLAELERQHGELVTLRASTPSGGLHLFFRAPNQAIRNRAGFLPGLDVRGDGGYVVVAPSIVGGKRYQWQNDTSTAEIPDWLLTLFTTGSTKSKTVPSSPPDKISYSDALRGVQEGARNDTIFRFACKLRQEEWEYDEALVIIKTAAANCEPPLDEEEAIRCLDNAWQYFPSAALTDVGNAKRFVARCGANVRYIQEKDSWLVWGDHSWKTNMRAISRMAWGTLKSIRDEAMTEGDEERRKALFAHSRKSETPAGLERMLEIAALELSVSADDLDRGDLTAFANGVFDTSTGTFRPGKREDLVTKRVRIPYDPSHPACIQGLKNEKTTRPVSTATVKSQVWVERLDNWLEERCQLGSGFSSTASELRADFSAWLGEEVTEQRFGRLLSSKEGIERRKSNVLGYSGVRLKKKPKK